ncbi:MAG: amidohydrolase [Bacillota bacterium]
MVKARHHCPDRILVNGPIYTADKCGRRFTGMAMGGGRITALGSSDEIGALAGEDTEVVNLEGRSAIPGIVDSHNHLPTAGAMMSDGVLLFDAGSIAELQQIVARKAQETAPGEWIQGAGWIENQFEEWRMPARWDLDEAAPDNPVILNRLFGMSVVNSRALELAGITDDGPDPDRGTADRDDRGRLTGVLRSGAQYAVREVMPKVSERERVRRYERYIRTAAREYTRYGITTLLDPGVPPLVMRAYQNVRERGEMPLRINMMPVWYGLRASEDQDLEGRLDHIGVHTNFGDEWLRLGALKMAIDGGLGSMTALMHEPFLDGTRSEIPLRLDPDNLEKWFGEGHSAGWSIGIHCCGDRAQDMACSAFDAVMRREPRGDVRHNIIHGYFATADALDIMERHGIAVSTQPGFMWVEGDLYFSAVSKEKLEEFEPLRTYTERGIVVACNSDMTSAHYNPFWGIHSAVTRKTSRGATLGDREKVDRFEALRMFTYNGAYLTFWEDLTGSLEVGKAADVAVLDRDYGSVGDDELRDLRVDMTIIDGECVFDRRPAGPGQLPGGR